VLMPFFARSIAFQKELQKYSNKSANFQSPVLAGLGDGLRGVVAAHNVTLEGRPTIGIVFFEQPLDRDAIERARRYPLIVTGSRWNERILRAHGISSVVTVFQGVDPSYFHPAPKLGIHANRFLVFSGGKAEMRKGQDIVLAAFKIFSQRHPEAMLVTAWHSPWPQLARALDRSGLVAPAVFRQGGELDVVGWAVANGIGANQILDLGEVPNVLMPPILREMDVAVFANRAEGGTNLVAMECMACGLPVILPRNTGHLDLIEDGNCYALDDQRQMRESLTGGADLSAWGDSQVEEVVARLEQAFTDRDDAKRRGVKASETLSAFTWAATAKGMKDIVLGAGHTSST